MGETPTATVAELLAAVEPDHLRMQVLGEVLDGKQTVRKDGVVLLRFATQAATLGDILSNRRTALIIWADTDVLEAARVKLLGEKEPASSDPSPDQKEGSNG